jgi:hypothetical protein
MGCLNEVAMPFVRIKFGCLLFFSFFFGLFGLAF